MKNKSTPNVGSEPDPSPGDKMINAAVLTAEWNIRRNLVYRWLLDGFRRADIIDRAATDGWGEDEAGVDELIASATDFLGAAATINPDAEMGKAILRHEQLYRDACRVSDLPLQLAILKEITKLLALKVKQTAADALVAAAQAHAAAPQRERFRIVK